MGSNELTDYGAAGDGTTDMIKMERSTSLSIVEIYIFNRTTTRWSTMLFSMAITVPWIAVTRLCKKAIV